MYHQKIDAADTVSMSGDNGVATVAPQPADATARFYAVLLVLALPVIVPWLLVRLVWEDVKAVARGVAIFYRATAEELSRS